MKCGCQAYIIPLPNFLGDMIALLAQNIKIAAIKGAGCYVTYEALTIS